MRFLKSFLLMVLASAFLVACGGGGDPILGDTGGGGSSGSANLSAVYDKIVVTSTVEQINALVGYAPYTSSTSAGSSIATYGWQSGSGNTYELLSIKVGYGNVVYKIYTGKTNSRSFSY
jgi:hypothetical protein